MSLELEGWNFEAYPHFKITLSGFCVITGEGNLGKSAISRFLRAVLFNDFDIKRVRTGAKESVCRIAFVGEPHDVMWVERKKSETLNSYEIGMRDGTTRAVGKAGSDDKGIPKELVDLGFSLLRTNAAEHNKHNLNFHRQMGDPLFLLQMGEAPLASFIHQVFRLDGEESALRRMNADAMEIRKVYDKRSKEIAKVGTALEKAAGRLATAEDAHARLQAALAQAEKAEADRGRAAASVAAFSRLQALQQANMQGRARLASLSGAMEALRGLREAAGASAVLRERVEAWGRSLRRLLAAEAALDALEGFRPRLEAMEKNMSEHRRLRLLQVRWTTAETGRRLAQRRAAAASSLLPPVLAFSEALKLRQRTASLARRWQAGEKGLEAARRRGDAFFLLQENMQAFQLASSCHLHLHDLRDSLARSQEASRLEASRHAALVAGSGPLADLAQALEARRRAARLILRLRGAQDSLCAVKNTASTLQRIYDATQAQDRTLRELLGHCPTCRGLPWIHHVEGKLHAA